METPENQTPPEKKTLDDSLKLLVREEIEKEVEKRIQRQEGFYWKFLALFGGFVAVFAFALWHVQLSELPGVVQKELATEAVMQAKDKIMEIKSSAESVNQNLNDAAAAVSNILISVADNQQAFTNRLNEIKQQDNIVLNDDIRKFFVSQTFTNFDGQKMLLDYEPIPETLQFSAGEMNGSYLTKLMSSHVVGKEIVYDDSIRTLLSQLKRSVPGQEFKLEVKYVRKSLR